MNYSTFWLMSGAAYLINAARIDSDSLTKDIVVFLLYALGIALSGAIYALLGKSVALMARRVYWKIYWRSRPARGRKIRKGMRGED